MLGWRVWRKNGGGIECAPVYGRRGFTSLTQHHPDAIVVSINYTMTEMAVVDGTDVPPFTMESNPEAFEAFKKVPATFANKFYIACVDNVVRISLGDQFGRDEAPVFHTSVALLTEDAHSLALSLLSVMSQANLLEPSFTLEVKGGVVSLVQPT